MTERAGYSDEEWATLIGAPVAVIAAVIGASPSGPVAIMREVGAAVKSFEHAAAERRANPLIAALLVSLKERFESIMGGADDPAVDQVDIMELGRDPAAALANCRAARELLERKAPPELSSELRAWLLEIGTVVAHAAPEGGFFGLGGEQVSAAEQAMLADLAEALGVERPA